ncbi:hypothetical protein [Jiangella gansuensis]|uniref:hypothetical protein n=1 Tax=Jiangella gansuensis TaxID=281473 RepID=UPI00047E8B33|nr:hypothetical protein [Jiangella gansuensis]
MTAATSYRTKQRKRRDLRRARKRLQARREQPSTMVVPVRARVLRQVGIWGGAVVLATGAYVGATIAAAAFLDDQDDESPLATAAEALGDDLVYVDPRAEDLLDDAELATLEEQAADASQPTRVVVWPLDGGWPADVVEHIAARSGTDSRFLMVNDEGRTVVASTLHEREPSIDDMVGRPPADAAAQALDELDATPLRGEPEEYEESSLPFGSTWLAAALGGALGVGVILVAVSTAFVGFGILVLAVAPGWFAVDAYRRRRAGPAIANVEARPARRRGKNRLVYRPPNDVLVRLNTVRVAERGERLRGELLALGERMAASTDDATGAAWELALDCYATAGRIADSVEGGTDLASHADVVAGLVLVARGRQAVDAAEAHGDLAESADCFANPFHGASVGAVPTIALGADRPPASVPRQVDVCATCRAAAEKGIAVADPLVLDSGGGRMREYWMLDVTPWAQVGYGAPSRELIDAWNASRV